MRMTKGGERERESQQQWTKFISKVSLYCIIPRLYRASTQAASLSKAQRKKSRALKWSARRRAQFPRHTKAAALYGSESLATSAYFSAPPTSPCYKYIYKSNHFVEKNQEVSRRIYQVKDSWQVDSRIGSHLGGPLFKTLEGFGSLSHVFLL